MVRNINHTIPMWSYSKRYLQYYKLIITYLYFRYEVKVLDELETKVEPAVHELRLGWSTDDTDMQLGKYFTLLCHLESYVLNTVVFQL